jgi:hypothetical protein
MTIFTTSTGQPQMGREHNILNRVWQMVALSLQIDDSETISSVPLSHNFIFGWCLIMVGVVTRALPATKSSLPLLSASRTAWCTTQPLYLLHDISHPLHIALKEVTPTLEYALLLSGLLHDIHNAHLEPRQSCKQIKRNTSGHQQSATVSRLSTGLPSNDCILILPDLEYGEQTEAQRPKQHAYCWNILGHDCGRT